MGPGLVSISPDLIISKIEIIEKQRFRGVIFDLNNFFRAIVERLKILNI
jgi:uncharacterized protein YjcR